jgi:hypothetical protein
MLKKVELKEENKAALLIVAFIYLVFTVVKTFFFIEQSLEWHVVTSIIGLFAVFFFGYVVRYIDIYLDSVYPFEKNPVKRILIQFLVTAGVIFFIRTVPFILFYDKLPLHPSREIVVATYAINIFMVLSVVLSIFGYHFFVRWKEEKIIAAELEKEKAYVQYDNLKNQLNPHFLFNALSSLNSLIFENPQLASDFLQQLSKVYRYVLENKEKNLVSVETEINFVNHYVQLLKTRFDGSLNVNFAVSEDAKEKKIVPVTLQVLLENAVKHNITSKTSPLNIEVQSENDFLLVKNNLQKKEIIETSNGQGLENLKNLYRYLSERGVEIREEKNVFTVKIPLIE